MSLLQMSLNFYVLVSRRVVRPKGLAADSAGDDVREVGHRLGLQVPRGADVTGETAGRGVRRDRQGEPAGNARGRGGQGLRHLRQLAGSKPFPRFAKNYLDYQVV